MKAIILAAGYATRLHPLTLECAKPLLKLGDKPIIEFAVDKLNQIDEIDLIFEEYRFSKLFNFAPQVPF